MGKVDHPQYFWPGVTPVGGAAPPPGPILLVKPKIHLVPPISLEWIFSYIFVNALMGNFQFWDWETIFWRGHRCKKFFWGFYGAIANQSKNSLATPKRKFSYILVNGLIANFQFWGHQTIFWLVFNRTVKSPKNFLHLWPLQKMVSQSQNWKFPINAFTNI